MSVAAAIMLAGCQADAPATGDPATATATATPDAAVTSASAAEISGPATTVLAFGDSLFAGYGLADPAAQSYPAQLEAALRADGRNVRIVNAGVSGDTTGAGRQRLAFTLDSQKVKPDFALLELGGNDLLRGLPPTGTRENLDAMLAEFKRRGIPVVLMGMRAPPNAGPQFQQAFDAIYPDLARKHGATLVPFLTEEVFTNNQLLQPDHVHPTAQGVATLVQATRGAIASALPTPAATPAAR